MLKIRILGSGTSSGVPRIGNDWGACDPNDSRNRRTRASVLVSTETTTILVDTSPDMREQLLAANVSDVDAVIWTHDHADHTHGIDDLRQLMHIRNGEPVRGYARPFTIEQLQHKGWGLNRVAVLVRAFVLQTFFIPSPFLPLDPWMPLSFIGTFGNFGSTWFQLFTFEPGAHSFTSWSVVRAAT